METPNTNDLKNAAKDVTKQASNKADGLIDKAASRADGLMNQASSTLQKGLEQGQQQAGELYDQAGEYYGMARERAMDAYDSSSDFVKRYPFYTVAGAVAVGFFAAMLLRRNDRH
ncbi:MAG: DUF883 family protein [Proteobacteria bacterium]|nr:MAG: DUF883 family protein [Pseudomonadota bacterium]